MIQAGDVLSFSDYPGWDFTVTSIVPPTPYDVRVTYRMSAWKGDSTANSDTEWVLYAQPQVGTGGAGKPTFTFLGGTVQVAIKSGNLIGPVIAELGEEHREWAEEMMWRSA